MICTTEQYMRDNFIEMKEEALDGDLCDRWRILLNSVLSFEELLEHVLVEEIAYDYALYVIKRPWSIGEAAIATSAQWSLNYAIFVIKGRWPMGEAAIAKDAGFAATYAKDFLKMPWSKCPGVDKSTAELAEESIARNKGLLLYYNEFLDELKKKETA